MTTGFKCRIDPNCWHPAAVKDGICSRASEADPAGSDAAVAVAVYPHHGPCADAPGRPRRRSRGVTPNVARDTFNEPTLGYVLPARAAAIKRLASSRVISCPSTTALAGGNGVS